MRETTVIMAHTSGTMDCLSASARIVTRKVEDRKVSDFTAREFIGFIVVGLFIVAAVLVTTHIRDNHGMNSSVSSYQQ